MWKKEDRSPKDELRNVDSAVGDGIKYSYKGKERNGKEWQSTTTASWLHCSHWNASLKSQRAIEASGDCSETEWLADWLYYGKATVDKGDAINANAAMHCRAVGTATSTTTELTHGRGGWPSNIATARGPRGHALPRRRPTVKAISTRLPAYSRYCFPALFPKLHWHCTPAATVGNVADRLRGCMAKGVSHIQMRKMSYSVAWMQ